MAQFARALNWTMNEVRQHTYRDMAAMLEVLQDEARQKQLARARARKGG